MAEENAPQRTNRFYDKYLLGDAMIAFFGLIAGILAYYFDIYFIDTLIHNPVISVPFYIFICFVISYPLILAINAIKIASSTKNQKQLLYTIPFIIVIVVTIIFIFLHLIPSGSSGTTQTPPSTYTATSTYTQTLIFIPTFTPTFTHTFTLIFTFTPSITPIPEPQSAWERLDQFYQCINYPTSDLELRSCYNNMLLPGGPLKIGYISEDNFVSSENPYFYRYILYDNCWKNNQELYQIAMKFIRCEKGNKRCEGGNTWSAVFLYYIQYSDGWFIVSREMGTQEYINNNSNCQMINSPDRWTIPDP